MEPLEVHVILKTDDEILALRAKVAELEAALAAEKAERNRAEYMFRCESLINSELVDLCRTHKVKFRPSLERRPW